MVGTVIELVTTPSGNYAWMSVESDQSPQFARVDKLTKLDATAIVAAFQALPQDDYAESRERAINSLRMRDLSDDYDQVRAAGDLGGAEIDLRDMAL